jgi:hypothetical protein
LTPVTGVLEAVKALAAIERSAISVGKKRWVQRFCLKLICLHESVRSRENVHVT